MEFGILNKLKEIRKEKGITQIELAQMTGLKQQYICVLEKRGGDNINLKTLKKIADCLGYYVVLCEKESKD